MQSIPRVIECLLVPLIWYGGVLAALSVHGNVLVNDHSLCGPWGCGPTSDALLAVHLAWFAAIWPPLLYIPWRRSWDRNVTARIGLGLVSISLTMIVGVCAWQWLVWRPETSEFLRGYIWQRCGFVLANASDWPLVQSFGIGLTLWTIYQPQKTKHHGKYGVEAVSPDRTPRPWGSK
ncbi:hypothetical protein Pla52o_22310 [Novipirellula galeiformis]|uniref:Uncharacterized protein n=1 Tax=Novipirellula galeiformis TaxID=2528004 RepID=A0A5C6CLI5_9BACT|nr:hypothetical protein Pla52o_22310 [Novipirellula galeiformis]